MHPKHIRFEYVSPDSESTWLAGISKGSAAGEKHGGRAAAATIATHSPP